MQGVFFAFFADPAAIFCLFSSRMEEETPEEGMYFSQMKHSHPGTACLRGPREDLRQAVRVLWESGCPKRGGLIQDARWQRIPHLNHFFGPH